jgi:hypothetical protein
MLALYPNHSTPFPLPPYLPNSISQVINTSNLDVEYKAERLQLQRVGSRSAFASAQHAPALGKAATALQLLQTWQCQSDTHEAVLILERHQAAALVVMIRMLLLAAKGEFGSDRPAQIYHGLASDWADLHAECAPCRGLHHYLDLLDAALRSLDRLGIPVTLTALPACHAPEAASAGSAANLCIREVELHNKPTPGDFYPFIMLLRNDAVIYSSMTVPGGVRKATEPVVRLPCAAHADGDLLLRVYTLLPGKPGQVLASATFHTLLATPTGAAALELRLVAQDFLVHAPLTELFEDFAVVIHFTFAHADPAQSARSDLTASSPTAGTPTSAPVPVRALPPLRGFFAPPGHPDPAAGVSSAPPSAPLQPVVPPPQARHPADNDTSNDEALARMLQAEVSRRSRSPPPPGRKGGPMVLSVLGAA